MRRHAQRLASRSAGAGLAQEVDIPLPLKGVAVTEGHREISGLFAERLDGWRTTVASIETAPQPTRTDDQVRVDFVQRIPFEFGSDFTYLEILDDRTRVNDRIRYDDIGRSDSYAPISAHLLMITEKHRIITFNGEFTQKTTFFTDTGKNPDTFTNLAVHQDMVFFWEKGDDLDFYYGEVGQIEGQLTRFPLGRLGNITGTIEAAHSITFDANDGINNLFCIFTSTGQMVAYSGNNPASAESWQIAARIKIPPPVDANAFVHVGADVWVLTAGGLVSISQSIRRGQLAAVNSISAPVRDEIKRLIAAGGRWQLFIMADASAVVMNHILNGEARQFIFYTETRTWGIESWPIREWHNIGRKIQATGLDGALYEYDALLSPDDEGPTRTAIWETSWFRLPRWSGVSYLRPTIITNSKTTITVRVLTGHNQGTEFTDEATQTIVLQPERPGETVALDEEIGVDASGTVFKLQIELEAKWAEIVNIRAGLI